MVDNAKKLCSQNFPKASPEPPEQKDSSSGPLIQARPFVAVALMSLSTFVQNGYVLPSLPALSALPISSVLLWGLLYTGAFAAWAALAHFARRPLDIGILTRIALMLLVGGAALGLASQAIGHPPGLLLASLGLLAIGRSWAVILAGLSLMNLAPRAILVTVATSVAVSYALSLALSVALVALPAFVSLLVYAFLPLAALVLVSGPIAKQRKERFAAFPPPNDLALTNPSSFPGPTNRLFICILLFDVAFGFSIQFHDALDTWAQDLCVGLALLVAACWCAQTRCASREDRLFQTTGLLVVLGFSLSLATSSSVSNAALMVLAVGSQLFSVLVWAVLAIVGSRNPLGGIAVMGLGFCASNLGVGLGAALRALVDAEGVLSPDAKVVMLALVATGFVAFIWLGLKGFSFSETIQGVKPVTLPTAPSPTPESDLETRCSQLAQTHGLTERESEVFLLLARGRNGAFIQDACHVTRNTAKTHIRRIYQKLGVHTHQELIDLVESDLESVFRY